MPIFEKETADNLGQRRTKGRQVSIGRAGNTLFFTPSGRDAEPLSAVYFREIAPQQDALELPVDGLQVRRGTGKSEHVLFVGGGSATLGIENPSPKVRARTIELIG